MRSCHPTLEVAGPEPVGEEFIELFNTGSTQLDLTGWRITGGVDFDFPAGTVIGAGKVLVVAGQKQSFVARHPGVTNVVGDFVRQSVVGPGPSTNYSGVLSNSRDTIDLEADTGDRIDTVA